MTFLHPWAIWLGVAAAAAPVVIHLLTRPRPVRLPLSTLRFVREAIQQRRARHRLRDVLILALRTLAVLLLALAVARPQWGERPLVSDAQTGDTVRVVILDLSQSMAATTGAVQAIERARTAAAGYLRYRPGLWANLIVAGARPRAVFEQPSSNFDALRDELARCEVLPQRLDVRSVLDLAARMLAPANEGDSRRRELVVVSDFQRENWAKADFSALPEDTQIQLESTAPAEPPPNLAILRAEARAAGAGGQSVQLQIEVGNFSPQTRKAVVEAAVGQRTCRLQAACAPGRRTVLTEQMELKGLGWQSGEARLVEADDALAADNACPFVVQVRPEPVYALLTRQPRSLRPSSSHFLQCGLAPERRQSGQSAVRVVRLDPSELDRAALAPANLIVLDHPGQLSADAITLLAGLLRRGRPILYVAGERVDAVNLKRLVQAAGNALQMPVEFLPPPAGQIRQNLFLASVRQDDPPFRAFGDQLTAVLRPLRFSGGLSSRRLETRLDEDLLATYNDGSACMVLGSSESGSLAVINADLGASNLPRTAAFVPLLEELIQRMLDRRHADTTALCGERLVVHLPAEAGSATGLQVAAAEAPAAGGSRADLGELSDEGLGTVWHWLSPARPGVYQVRRDGQPVFSLAVRIPAEESQLDSLTPEVLRERLAGGRNVYYRSAAGEAQRRDDFWQWLAVACVVCMLGEITTLLAFRT